MDSISQPASGGEDSTSAHSVAGLRTSSGPSSDLLEAMHPPRSVSPSLPPPIDPRLLPAPSALPGSVTVYEQTTSTTGDQTTTRVVTYVVNNPSAYPLGSNPAAYLPHTSFLPSLPAPYPFTQHASAKPVLTALASSSSFQQPATPSAALTSQPLRHVVSSPALAHQTLQPDAASHRASTPRSAELLSPSEQSSQIEEYHLFSPSPRSANSASSLVSATPQWAPAPPSSTAAASHSSLSDHGGDVGGRGSQSLVRRRPGSTADSPLLSAHDSSSEYSDGDGTHGSLADTPVAARHLKRNSELIQSTAPRLRTTLSSAHTAFRRWEKAWFDQYLPVLSPSSPLRAQSLPLAFLLLILLLAFAWWAGWLLSLQSVEVALPITPLSVVNTPAASLLWGDSSLSTPRGRSHLPVHLIAACSNRLSALRASLPTWLAVAELSSVTVVDWGSDEPMHERLRDELELLDGRLRLVRLTERREWMLPTAVNLALHFLPLDTPSLLLKVDCDTLLHPDFVAQHPLIEQRFYAGEARKARNENELHLSGVLLVPTLELLAVNGYDERLQSYGYEDTNVVERLRAANLTPLPLRYQYIQHQKHSDLLRRADRPASMSAVAASSTPSVATFNSPSALTLEQVMSLAPPAFELQLHRILLEAVPTWNASMHGATFRVQPGEQRHMYEATLQQLPARVEDLLTKKAWLSAVRRAAEVTLQQAGVQVERLERVDHVSPTVHYLMRLVAFYGSDHGRPALIVQVQHGLSNRLRGLASAAAVASSMRLQLKVVWLPDHHCNATFSQLFRVRDELGGNGTALLNASLAGTAVSKMRIEHVWEDASHSPAVQTLDPARFDLYNYMEPQAGAVKDQLIAKQDRPKSWRGLYVKSAYRLRHASTRDDRNLQRELSSLLLSEPLLELLDLVQQPLITRGADGRGVEVSAVRVPAFEDVIGIHIRNRAPGSEIEELSADEYPPDGWATLERARSLSTAEVYAAEIQAVIDRDLQQRFYVSTDSSELAEQLQQTFGAERISYFARNDCVDRSAVCTQLALVDQLMLAQCARLIGSVWSSFSEVAALWRMRDIKYPAEVVAAVQGALTQAQATASPPQLPDPAHMSDAPQPPVVQQTTQTTRPSSERPFFLTPDILSAPLTDPSIADFVLPPAARTSSCRIEVFSILGERCSGTQYLQRLLESNFDVRSTDEYHYRHFFGFEQPDHPYAAAQCTLFVGVVRSPVNWLDCLFKYQWQLDQWQYPDWTSFLSKPIHSYRESEMNYTLSLLPADQRAAARDEMLTHPLYHDRNFASESKAAWQDVFELRRVKAAHMVDAFRGQVDKYVLVRLEDLADFYAQFLHILRLWFNLRPRQAAEGEEVLGVESPVPAYANAEMDGDVAEDLEPLHGHEHVHVTPELHELIWGKLDKALELQFGYSQQTD